MQLTLVDSLRCPAHYAESSLVLSVEKWAGRRVAEGVLGCPMCHRRYPIHRGTVAFTEGRARVKPPTATPDSGVSRLAAQLGLTEAGGIVLLTGRYASLQEALAGVTDLTWILLDAVDTMAAAAVNFDVHDRLPLKDGTLRGAAVDEPRNAAAFLEDVVRCLRSGGRLVASAATPIPAGIRAIAKDDMEWVGEVVQVSPTVVLQRSARPGKV